MMPAEGVQEQSGASDWFTFLTGMTRSRFSGYDLSPVRAPRGMHGMQLRGESNEKIIQISKSALLACFAVIVPSKKKIFGRHYFIKKVIISDSLNQSL